MSFSISSSTTGMGPAGLGAARLGLTLLLALMTRISSYRGRLRFTADITPSAEDKVDICMVAFQ
jgi:hypothetical protein